MLSSKFNGYSVHLVQSLDDMYKIRKLLDSKVTVGLDTETSGLSYISDSIAGVCIAAGHAYDPQHYHGFYIPVDHISYEDNLPKDKVIEFTQEIVDNYVTAWWNRDFDATFLEKEGLIFPCVGKTHDAQCMAHLIKGDSMPALKDFAEDLLKLDVLHYSDNNAEKGSFKTTDPRTSYIYAAGDPILTTLLARKIWTDYPYIHKIYPLDNKFAECMRKFMQTTELYVDKVKVKQFLDINAVELQKIRSEIFAFVGYQFKLDSNVDKAEALSRYVTLTVKTKKGQFKVDKEVLNSIDHPLAKMLLKYANLQKFRSTYLMKMADFEDGFRICYQHVNVSTGRLSSGGSKGNDYYSPFNIQNVPKVEIFRSLHHDSSADLKYRLDDEPLQSVGGTIKLVDGSFKSVIDVQVGDEVETFNGFKEVKGIKVVEQEVVIIQNGDKDLLCYSDSYVNINDGWTKAIEISRNRDLRKVALLDLGSDVYSAIVSGVPVQISTLMQVKAKGGMRDCFIPPKGYLWISCDYASEEVRILANLSKEPFLLEPLKNGEDIHKYVATKMFGHYDPSHRTIAKTITFAANYGGTGYTIAKRLGIPAKEGEELLERYNKTLKRAFEWKQASIKEGRRKGLVFTYFGRPRAVWMYYQSSDPGMHGFADRTCMNSPIQGVGGDVIRLDYIKFWDMYDKRSKHYDSEFVENVKHALTVHDETNWFVKPTYLQQALEKVQQVMTLQMPNWEVPLTVSPSVGVDWGHQIEIKGFTHEGVIIPDCDEDLSLL